MADGGTGTGTAAGATRAAGRWTVTAVYGVLLGVAAALVTFILAQTPFFQRLNLFSLDLRYRQRPPIEFRSDLGYIDFDDTSIALCGKWVWPRTRQISLIQTLGFYDARANGYDVFFTEPNDIIFSEPQVRLAEKTSRTPQEAAARVATAFRDLDVEMASAIAEAGNIYLASFMILPDAALGRSGEDIRRQVAENKGRLTQDRLEALELAAQYALPSDSTMERNLFKSVEIVTPLGNLEQAAAGVGYAQIIEDMDKNVRMYPLFIYYDGRAFPSIAVMMLAKIMQVPIERIRVIPGEYIELPDAIIPADPGFAPDSANLPPTAPRLVRIPIDRHCQMLVNWGGKYYDNALHLSYLDFARWHALNRAKEIARTWSPDPSFLPSIRDEIQTILSEERLAFPAEADSLATSIALCRILEPLLAEGRSIDEAIGIVENALPAQETLRLRTYRPKQIASVLAAGLASEADPSSSTPGDLDPLWRDEIRRNVRFFSLRDRLDDVRPLYFPPPIQAMWAGRMRLFSPTMLEGKTFMSGLTGVGTIDLNPMPFEKSCPMVALHLNALNTIITEQFLMLPPTWARTADAAIAYVEHTLKWSGTRFEAVSTFLRDFFAGLPGPTEMAWTLALAILVGIFCAFTSPSRGFVFSALVAASFTGYVYWQWIEHGQWVQWLTPLAAISLVYGSEVTVEFVKATREKQKVRGIFSTMVSPKVLKLMEDNPDRFSLTGVRKPATTFFSAIDGFGQVMKRESPDELSTILSWYLTPTSEIIMDYDGYIDKYEGHIIMADFGVPLDDPDHAWKCCFAAVEQQMDIQAFRKFVLARYGAEVRVSMGINSGYISAGNMGSERKMQYTVMGDAVNVSARFRPANGIYSTDIITGEAAEPLIRDRVELRMLDRLLLKGKTKPTTIYEVMGWKREAYLAAKKGRPVPESTRTRWLKCPSEKVFGYIEFWRQVEKDHGNRMADEIATFFESMVPHSEGMMQNGAVLMIRRLKGSLDHLAETLHKADGQSESAIDAEGDSAAPEWKNALAQWLARVDALSARIREARTAGKAAPSGLPSFPELALLASTLQGKIATLSENLERKPKSGLESVARALAAIRAWLEGKEHPDAEKNLHEHAAEYRSSAEEFYRKVERRAEEYHEMMAAAGSLTPARVRLRELYEEALRLHWDRKWDEALALLNESKAAVPGDGPVNELIARIERYKDEPPPASWQGEFVQKKK